VHGSNTETTDALRRQVELECRGRLCVRRNGMTAKTRRFFVTAGFTPDHNLGVYNNNVDTIERALIERYFLCKDGDHFRPAFKVGPSSYKSEHFVTFRSLVLGKLESFPVLTRQQVVDSYRGAKYKSYAQAMLSLQRNPLTKADSLLTSFSKFEKVDVSKPPRVINPRSKRYNLELGRYIKRAEHSYFKAINFAFGALTPATVIKGYNADASASILFQKWSRFRDPVAIGLDATKFDMHVSVCALKYEHSFYTAKFPGDLRLRRLLRWQLHNRGTAYAADGTIKFEMHGTRSSGDLNTSLGNCILMCSIVWAYCQNLGIQIELANNGDDCVVFMERRDEPLFRSSLCSFFKLRGFAMVLEETVDEFEQVEFCQTRPVQLATGWRMVRNLPAMLRKDPMCLIPLPNAKVYRKWLDAVGTCGTILCSGVPVAHAFYDVFKKHGVNCGRLIDEVFKNRSQLTAMKGVREGTNIDARARVSYYYAFGVTPDLQVVFEDYLRTAVLDVNFEPPIYRSQLRLSPGFNIDC